MQKFEIKRVFLQEAQDIVDFLTVMEITNKSKASDSDIDKLAYDVKNSWWNKNKDRLLNESNN
ncbi:MAG: hypothetical protein A2015_10630 [Spirochaetes bacterium GWF1_31_7]|nr:MAG: hypothetical protein A2Y29_00105 [Spirochaetes bacterium GWE2_31_10]OHD48156.1 MAG: hypothetical protein A2015_10630 [Spirochaetes bacterium GWF1_31_7]OHD83241.1 MAG: hypothetical protein A2355_06125 [Spirochaetes bacterium RIFOXYB1_FULL_32_8]HBD93498.1 hypothetical protein [Spirochaetia bacterium]HBI37063.1 hypothetical protein [Spirochaetia bacterium]